MGIGGGGVRKQENQKRNENEVTVIISRGASNLYLAKNRFNLTASDIKKMTPQGYRGHIPAYENQCWLSKIYCKSRSTSI